jgi:type II secretory pathway pseudopilin PulG
MQRSQGFTYLGLLIAVAVMGIGLALIGDVWSTTVKRERERELLFVGAQFRQAIGRYYEGSPGVKQFPRTLEDLLQDNRFPVVKRYLRKVYLDPMTGKREWGLLKQGDQILGVYSQSKDKPLKVANFQAADAAFADSNAYSDWRFVYAPFGAGSPGQAAGAPGAADGQLPNAAGPSLNAGGPSPMQPGAPLPAGPGPITGMPQEPPMCIATRMNDFRACASATTSQAKQACEQAAMQRFSACTSAASGGTR